MTSEDDQRAIDAAMAASYESKKYVRSAWLDEVKFRYNGHGPGDRVLYLTLCGRHAIDIQMLIDAGIVKRMENGVAIDLGNSPRVVAFESNSPAATDIKKNFIGLDVTALDIHSELRIQAPLNFPDNKVREKFRAAVVNLDYDRAAQITDGMIIPVRAVSKIGQIQQAKKEPWSLLLTLNSTITWSETDQKIEQQFLAAQLEQCPEAMEWLRNQCDGGERCLTEPLTTDVLPVEAVQAFHLLLTAARLAEALCAHGWQLTVHRAFRYGTQEERAPMVSWVFRLDYVADAERRRGEFVIHAVRSLIEVAESIAHLDDPPD